MKIFHLSDTHGKHRQLGPLPAGDVIVHSGDFTFAGSEEEAFDFINWYCDLPCRHKIFMAGNPERLSVLSHLPHLRCHLFGHEHDAVRLERDEGFIFSNASAVDHCYHLYKATGRPIEL